MISTSRQHLSGAVETRSTASAMNIGWCVTALAGFLSVACSSGSPTATRLPAEGDTSAVSALTSESTEVSLEGEELALPCLQILDVSPTSQVAPGDQIEIEVRCLLTSNADRVRVTFGVGSSETATVRADSIDGVSPRTIVATVPERASDGLIEIRVGLFQSVVSSVSIDISDSGPVTSFLVSANFGDGSNNTLTLLNGSESGEFIAEDLVVGEAPRAVSVADVVGDDNFDIIALNSADANISVLAGDGAGNFTPAGTFTLGPDAGAPTSMAVGDINDDDIPDVVVASDSFSEASVIVLLGNGSGFGFPNSFPVDPRPFAIAIGDVTGDGQADIIVPNDASGTDSITVLEGNGNGSFPTTQVITEGIGNRPRSVAVGDLTNDGILDIVVGNSNDDTVSILTADGTGGFDFQATATTGADPRGLTIADATGDGVVEIITANNDDNTVTLLDSSTLTGPSFDVGVFPSSVLVADLNRDGNPDIVTANFGDDTLSFLAGNGGGSFSAAESLAVGPGPFAVAAPPLPPAVAP